MARMSHRAVSACRIITVLTFFGVLSLILYRSVFNLSGENEFHDLSTAVHQLASGLTTTTRAAEQGIIVNENIKVVSALAVKEAEKKSQVVSSARAGPQTGSSQTTGPAGSTITTVSAVSNLEDEEGSMEDIKALLRRGQDFMEWVLGNSNGTSSVPFIRWDKVSFADIHIIHRLVSVIRFYMASAGGKKMLLHLLGNGRQCSPLQAAQQELISRYIKMDICSEVEWYKLLHLGWPEAKRFFDVGANKGYLGSLFLTLWGGGRLKASPKDVLSIAMSMNAWKGSRNPSGYCRDGENNAIHSFCPAKDLREKSTGRCDTLNEDVEVYSFDGSSYLTRTLNTIISAKLGIAGGDAAKGPKWVYNNFAVSDVEGTARFTKQDENTNAGYEGGGIKKSIKAEDLSRILTPVVETEEVPMTSLDAFIKKYNISTVDLLKIDTEGNDNKVINGAKKIISEQAGFVAFEGGSGVTLSKQMIVEFSKSGYACYSTSRAGLFKWSDGCMKDKYTGGFRAKDKGNIFCVNRKRAPLAAFAYELLSFPTSIEYVLSKSSGSALKSLKKVLNDVDNKKDELVLASKIDAAALVPLYINTKGFCRPFPQCARGDVY